MQTNIGKDIVEAKKHLDNGDIVAIPTETVYGLAGNAFDKEAVGKIYSIKKRPQFNPLILHTNSRKRLLDYVQELPKKIERLVDDFMPGPLTILLPKSNIVPDIVTAGSDKVAIRIPSNQMTLDLLAELEYPLAAPSANISGYVSPTKTEHVFENLNGKIPYILDGGDCSIGLESTILGYDEKVDKVVLHRLGGLNKDAIENFLGEQLVDYFVDTAPSAPGQLKSHYATKTPLILGKIEDVNLESSDVKIALINYSEKQDIPVFKQFVLTPSSSINEAAHNLFTIMREADNCGADFIIIDLVPNKGIGLAINDRLKRAQHHFK